MSNDTSPHATEPVDPASTDALATTLRVRVLAMNRLQSGFEDTPVIGAAAFALGAWLLWPARPAPGPMRILGLELVFLAVAVNSRQDFGSLETGHLVRSIDERFEAEAVARSRAEAAKLSMPEAVDRIHALLADRRLRSPFVGL